MIKTYPNTTITNTIFLILLSNKTLGICYQKMHVNRTIIVKLTCTYIYSKVKVIIETG